MKKSLFILAVSLLLTAPAFACNACESACDDVVFVPVPGPAGPAGPVGIGEPGPAGPAGPAGPKGDPVYSSISKKDNKTAAGLAGLAAGARIDHAKDGGMAAGIGLATIDSGEAVALGVGKSWKKSGRIKEYVLDATVFLGTSGATEATGAAVALTAHF